LATLTSHNCPAGPEIDQSVDVTIERIRLRKNVEHAMNDHVRLERTHEQKSECAGISAANDAGVHRPPEVVDDNREAAARRTVLGIRVERHNQRASTSVHEDGDVFADQFFSERHELFGNRPKNHARITPGIRVTQVENHIGRRGHPAAHRLAEQLELRRRVAQHCRRSDMELAGDVGQRRGVKPLRGEHASCGFQKLLARDPCRPAHL